MSKKNKKLMCAVYLSVDAPDKEIQDKEEKQFRYIKDYCKGNGLKIVKLYHRAGLSRCEMQKHFVELARQIEVGELQAVVIANSRYISCGVYDLYMKVCWSCQYCKRWHENRWIAAPSVRKQRKGAIYEHYERKCDLCGSGTASQ